MVSCAKEKCIWMWMMCVQFLEFQKLMHMELQMWERIRDQDLDYADEDIGAFQEPMSVIEQEEALKLYDAGAFP